MVVHELGEARQFSSEVPPHVELSVTWRASAPYAAKRVALTSAMPSGATTIVTSPVSAARQRSGCSDRTGPTLRTATTASATAATAAAPDAASQAMRNG